MIVNFRPLAELNEEALRVLYDELGLVGTVRFLRQFTVGYGNYTEQRRERVAEETVEDALNELYRYQACRKSDSN